MADNQLVQLIFLLYLLYCNHLITLIRYQNQQDDTEVRSRVWVSELNTHNNRRSEYHAYLLYREFEDASAHLRYTRMNKQTFDWILARIEHRIKKNDTTMRAAIPPMERLAMTLNYLASGNSFTFIADRYMRGISTVGEVIDETCTAIWEEFSGEYLTLPSTEEEWQKIGKE